nr:MAG TPA: hypothetical protein [Caudoviricetes sp.]
MATLFLGASKHLKRQRLPRPSIRGFFVPKVYPLRGNLRSYLRVWTNTRPSNREYVR